MWHVLPEREKKYHQNKKTAFENMKTNRRSNQPHFQPWEKEQLFEPSQIRYGT